MNTDDNPNDSSSTSCGNIDTIEQILTKLKTLSGKPIGGEDSVDTRRQVWIDFLELWTKMLYLAVITTELDATCFANCISTFSAILEKAHINELLKTDGSIAHKTFFDCLNLLNIPAVHQYLLGRCAANTPFSDICFMNVQYLLMLSSSSCTHVPFNNDLPDTYVTLLDVLRINVEKKILTNLSGKKKELGPIANFTLNLLWNMVDRTILVPLLLRTGLAASAVQWLANSASLTATGRRPLISIVHNIARHDDGADELNKHNAIDVIKAYQSTYVLFSIVALDL
jgi:hypothetical protein